MNELDIVLAVLALCSAVGVGSLLGFIAAALLFKYVAEPILNRLFP